MTSEVSAISINVETSNRPLSLRKAERGIVRFSIADELELRERAGNPCYHAIRRRPTVSREVSPHELDRYSSNVEHESVIDRR